MRFSGSDSSEGAAKTEGRCAQQWPTSTTEEGARRWGGPVMLERSPWTVARNWSKEVC